jgi:hypothetical protein
MQLAAALMRAFAAETGLAGTRRPERYLWTDAFAVCNWLGLHRQTGKAEYLELALLLVNQVHRVLGRHRDDDARRGWISGLPEEEGERHPTRGGLRIGKPMPERGPADPFDPHAEWERDGQYLHYLTQWMHALHRVAEATGKRAFDDWAVELAQSAHAAFARRDGRLGGVRLVWKMSIDLRRVLVPSMGQHDALDALASYLELQGNGPVLSQEIAEARQLATAGALETDDALGIGAVLTAGYRLGAPIRPSGAEEQALLDRVLAAAALSLEVYAQRDPLSAPAHSRLAFRELGLAIGLHAMDHWRIEGAPGGRTGELLGAVLRYLPLASRIDEFWSVAGNRRAPSWTEHPHINGVMLATSLLPEGYLGI